MHSPGVSGSMSGPSTEELDQLYREYTLGAPLSPPVPQVDAAYEVLHPHLFYSPFARCYNRFCEIGWIPGQVLARVVPGWRAVECPVCQEPLGARCPDWVTPLDDCRSHAGWRLCSWHHFSRLVNAIQVAGGYPTQEEAQWRTSAWVVRISVEGYPITFTQRIDRQVAHLEAVAGVATQPGADPQVEAGQAPPEPTLAEQVAPEEPSNTAATGPLEAPAEAGREPFLLGSASASDNSTSPARDPDSGTAEESPDSQRGRCSAPCQRQGVPSRPSLRDQEETPFLRPKSRQLIPSRRPHTWALFSSPCVSTPPRRKKSRSREKSPRSFRACS